MKTLLKSDRNPEGSFRPQLTSLVDVMTILLVFLIKSFSVEGNLVTSSSNLELPISQAKKTPRAVTSIEITKKAIVSEGTVIASFAEFENNDTLAIPPLQEWMQAEASKSPSVSKAREILIQSDKEVEFNVVKRVMYTCSKAGFDNFTVLVLQEG